METYLEDNRPSMDDVCEEEESCSENCPCYKVCHPNNVK